MKSFDFEGRTYTSVEADLCYEMVPKSQFKGKTTTAPTGNGYDAIEVQMRGIPYVLMGPPIRFVPRPGQCMKCGCTELQACKDGCSWANKEQTLCSKC